MSNLTLSITTIGDLLPVSYTHLYFKLYSPRPTLIGNDIADFCKRIGIADNEGHLNYGGLICFGKEEWVRRYVPTFWMDLVEIPGRSVREARTR